jgi:hypothetical protein
VPSLLILFGLSWSVDNTVLWWFWILVAVVWAVWLGIKYLDWNFTHFVVTTDRVVFRTGVLAKHGVASATSTSGRASGNA